MLHHSTAHKPDIITLSLDVMGGDGAPRSVIHGADIALKKHGKLHFLLHGDEAQIAPLLSAFPRVAEHSTILHTSEVIANDDKPSLALRRGRNSSMGQAIHAVREGRSLGAVSSGNTGAMMAMAKLMLRTLPGIDRPAICALLPTEQGRLVMLDLGANSACSADNLFEFAVMGNAFARALLHVQRPTIGLLNVGVEEMKGNEAVRSAAQLIRESGLDLNFKGFVEGDDICKGTVDVVVTDGFTGNIALKTAEGTAKFYTTLLKQALTSSLVAKLGALLAKPALGSIKERLDPRTYNGAMFLGLNGIVVKSHGSSDEIGFASAIGTAVQLARQGVNHYIIEEMVRSGHVLEEEADDMEEEGTL